MASNLSITITAIDKATAVAQKVNKSIAQVTKPIADVRQSVAAFSKETGLDKLGRSVEKVGTASTETARRIASLAPPIAALTGAGTLAGIGAIAQRFGRSAVQIKNTAYNLGMGTTELQNWQGAARLAGLSSESMTNGLMSVGNALELAQLGLKPEALAAMTQYGIGVHRLKNGSIDTARAMRDVARVASTMTNAQARNRFLDAFGLQGLAPMLAELDTYLAKFQQLNAAMGPDQIAKGQQYTESMVALGASIDKLTNSAGAALAPALGQVANELIPIADKYGPQIANWIESTDWKGGAQRVGSFVDAVGGVGPIAAGIALITFAGPIAGALTLAGMLKDIAAIAGGLAANPVIASTLALVGGGYAAENARRKAFDSAIHRQAGESESSREQRVADAMAGGIVTPDVDTSAGSRAGAWTDWDNWWNRHFGQDSKRVTASPPAVAASTPPVAATAPVAPVAAVAPTAPVARAAAPSPVSQFRSNEDTRTLFSGLEAQYSLPPGLLDSVYTAESGRGRTLVSPKGALGPFQFMPETAREYGVTDPMDLRQSATGAARMYSDLLRANGNNLPAAIAAYNWGQGNLNRYGFSARPAETREYVDRVLDGMDPSGSIAGAPAQQDVGAGSGMAADGHVKVDVQFANAPKGMTASVKTRGDIVASTRISYSSDMVGGNV
ncbi:hypothetical protein CY652_10655 [Burkholderia sp. WAC0059]|uniref:lytic transglycosylase domain-containing protein n=1 Tax=Burkholderia sp. WAC0059 TaxID=2066022 RepID=UPI000C7EEC90|nr:lytic transglycosylase domain-containing protein [Burkholderia sp. WAC0059]PLZ02563.1 hypothetical protein CY652_10655 [Burkholderia sp. WAC0059]